MIDTIISSSVLILIILIVRFGFRGKINPMVQYGLWGLAALRLVDFGWLDLHPVESVLSVMNITGNATEAIRQASAAGQAAAGNAKVGIVDNAIPMIDNAGKSVMTGGGGISAAAAVDWQFAAMVIWAAGAIILGLWLIFVNLKFGRKIYQNRIFLMSVCVDYKGSRDFKGDTSEYEKIKGEKGKYLPVYIAEGLDSPCLMGYGANKAIYVTSEVAADGQKLRYAIAHELCHYRHYDLIWSIVRSGLLVFYWFNPLIWAAAIMSKRDCELACDYGVIKEIGREDRLAYGKTLVDLVSRRERKNNVLQVATTMQGSAHGMKERVMMIARNNKMKTPILIIVLLIMVLSVGFTFTAAPNHAKDLGNGEKAEIQAFATKWADAFSQRDAKTIHELCKNEDLYLTIGGVAENGEYWMGVSSPWPWNKDYVIDIVDPSTVSIYYYFRTSSPTVYVAKETIAIKKIEGEYKVVRDSWKHFDKIESKSDFDDAYKFGFPELAEFAPAYQFQADNDTDYNRGRKEILENPVTAAIDQLNISGAKVSGIYSDPYEKKAVVKFTWSDGEVTVNLIQPMFTDESGAKKQATIWIVDNEKWPEQHKWREGNIQN